MALFGPSKYVSARDAKLAQRSKALAAATQLVAEIPVHAQEDVIVNTPAHELASKIKAKEWSSLVVVAAFARQCLAAQEKTNCLTEGIPPVTVLATDGSGHCRGSGNSKGT